jgi:hypothetical protein
MATTTSATVCPAIREPRTSRKNGGLGKDSGAWARTCRKYFQTGQAVHENTHTHERNDGSRHQMSAPDEIDGAPLQPGDRRRERQHVSAPGFRAQGHTPALGMISRQPQTVSANHPWNPKG